MRPLKKLVIVILWAIISNAVWGQAFNNVLITDNNYFLRKGVTVNSESFPFYFNDQINSVIQDELVNHIKTKFNVDSISFLRYGGVNYSEGIFLAPKLNLGLVEDSEGKTLFLALETILQESTIIAGIVTYRLITRVSAENNQHKKIFKFNYRIPFQCQPSDSISGNIIMNSTDFLNIYLAGIEGVFKAKEKKGPLKLYARPTNNHYNDFMKSCQMLYFAFEKNEIKMGNSKEIMKTAVHSNYKLLNSSHSSLDFGKWYKSNAAKEGYSLTNSIDNSKYLLKLHLSESSVLNSSMQLNQLTAEIKDSTNKSIGNFVLNDFLNFEGKYADIPYLISWNGNFESMEIYENGVFIGLLNLRSTPHTAFFLKSVDNLKLAALFNMILGYNLSSELYNSFTEEEE